MYLAIDIILAVIMAAVIFDAVRRGFIVTLFRLLSTIASVVVAILFFKELGAYFYDVFVFDNIAPYIRSLAEQAIADMGASVDVSALPAELPEDLRAAAEMLGVDVTELSQYIPGGTEMGMDAIAETVEKFAVSLSTSIANILAFAALFFGTLILLSIVCFILDKLAKLPLLNGTNRFLGFVLGVCEALVLGIVLAHLSSTICSTYGMFNEEFAFAHVAENTYIAKFLLEISPF